MPGIKSEIFGGLMWNPPTIIDGFATEAANIKRAPTAQASHYYRLADVAAAPTVAASRLDLNNASVDSIWEIARDIAGKSTSRSYLLLIVVLFFARRGRLRGIHQALQPEAPVTVAAPGEARSKTHLNDLTTTTSPAFVHCGPPT